MKRFPLGARPLETSQVPDAEQSDARSPAFLRQLYRSSATGGTGETGREGGSPPAEASSFPRDAQRSGQLVYNTETKKLQRIINQRETARKEGVNRSSLIDMLHGTISHGMVNPRWHVRHLVLVTPENVGEHQQRLEEQWQKAKEELGGYDEQEDSPLYLQLNLARMNELRRQIAGLKEQFTLLDTTHIGTREATRENMQAAEASEHNWSLVYNTNTKKLQQVTNQWETAEKEGVQRTSLGEMLRGTIRTGQAKPRLRVGPLKLVTPANVREHRERLDLQLQEATEELGGHEQQVDPSPLNQRYSHFKMNELREQIAELKKQQTWLEEIQEDPE
ncbi:hypothetical protein ccbrp13_41990 [Ktedonobacteria bacterium brp13]|nr:hypothetical protein ccbrp13_41990 [Ktedonobacteria bacterium brp13]